MNFFSAFGDECPNPWQARREGEEVGHRGWGESNPYSERARENRDQPYCEEAEQAWRMGRYAGEDRKREEDEREERHRAYLAQQERERQEQQQIEYEEEMQALAQEEQTES
ncbi:hypothetical protein LCGC14_1971310 [marine sediment metagenome]|uniref:Uncharacterized protein n=1 Tax=marine sediment metagenome TaxID=412755 RepID=A0A0F9HQ35_9ZZZZ